MASPLEVARERFPHVTAILEEKVRAGGPEAEAAFRTLTLMATGPERAGAPPATAENTAAAAVYYHWPAQGPVEVICRRCLPHAPGTMEFIARGYRAFVEIDFLDDQEPVCSKCRRSRQEVA